MENLRIFYQGQEKTIKYNQIDGKLRILYQGQEKTIKYNQIDGKPKDFLPKSNTFSVLQIIS
jgi:hypothetical protein